MAIMFYGTYQDWRRSYWRAPFDFQIYRDRVWNSRSTRNLQCEVVKFCCNSNYIYLDVTVKVTNLGRLDWGPQCFERRVLVHFHIPKTRWICEYLESVIGGRDGKKASFLIESQSWKILDDQQSANIFNLKFKILNFHEIFNELR